MNLCKDVAEAVVRTLEMPEARDQFNDEIKDMLIRLRFLLEDHAKRYVPEKETSMADTHRRWHEIADNKALTEEEKMILKAEFFDRYTHEAIARAHHAERAEGDTKMRVISLEELLGGIGG